MRLPQKLALLWAMLTLAGCRTREPVPETPMPANTVLLSRLMRQLSAEPGFTEGLLKQLRGQSKGKRGPALLTPELIDELRARILGKNWQGLDRFPSWTMREINPTVRLASHFAGEDPKLEGESAVHPGSAPPPMGDRQARVFLDLGPYTLDRAGSVSLDEPSPLPPFRLGDVVTPLGHGLLRGDGPNALAAEHAQSQQLADIFNRLSANALPGAGRFTASVAGRQAHTPAELVAALLGSRHAVTVTDSRYFANFGHLHSNGMDVMMPFWMNTGLAVPGSGGWFGRPRPLLVPVSHAEYEWHIRGPRVNADISHYFGVDGKAEWRTMDTLDQAWVGKRDAHIYTGDGALEVTRLVNLVTVAYMHGHARRPDLPFGGYYTLGVCQDPVSAIERRMTGRSTLFPNTADSRLFDDPRDAEVNGLMAAIPNDRAGARPQPERIFGSLPADPGVSADFPSITIPGLRADLQASYMAWHSGTLQVAHGRLFYEVRAVALGAAVLLLLGLGIGYARRGSR